MSVEQHPQPSGDRTAADRYQAEYFRDELNRELEALDEQAHTLRAELADHLRNNRALQTYRAQENLRSVAVTRRSVVDMLSALACRFPGNAS